jgi:putative endonuclease
VWSVYVLRCADGSYYTGITNDLTRRLLAHRAGKASKYTRARLPVRLACTLGTAPTRGAALRLEAQIKAMTRREKRALIRASTGSGGAARLGRAAKLGGLGVRLAPPMSSRLRPTS